MNPVELVIGLLLAAAVLATLARKLRIPYPVLLVLGGLALGFVHGLPPVRVPPDVVFLVFLPPLVYIAAAQVALRDFHDNLRPILLLAIGLGLATLVCVGAVTTWGVEGFTWATALVLAGIIGPTDTVAVNAVTGRMPIPRRISAILEGESLVNDIVALVAYKMAVDAVMTGRVSYGGAAFSLLWGSTAAVAVGLVVGVVATWVRKKVMDCPSVSLTLSILTGFAAFLAAEAVEASGILATVTAGLYVGRQLSHILTPEGRVQAISFWENLTFLLQGLAFVLIGLELRTILEDLSEFSLVTLLGYGALVSGAVIVLRLTWVFPFAYLPLYLFRRIRERDPYPPWRQVFVVGWAGMRGVDSLAAALALPLALPDGRPFPQRNLILFLSFSVILSTLVFQGLSLPLLIRWFRLKEDGTDDREEALARTTAALAALRRIAQLESSGTVAPDVLATLRAAYEKQVQRYQAQLDPADDGRHEKATAEVRHVRRELLRIERGVLTGLRDEGIINDDVLRRVERSLDYEELRLED